MSFLDKLSTFILVITLISLPTDAQPRSGSIIADETWSILDSPVEVDGLLTVERNVILTINAGVEVLFTDQSGLIVKGLLFADGSVDDSIRFTSTSAKLPGAWGGIYIRGQWTGSTRLQKKKKALAEEIAARSEEVFEDARGNTYKQVGQYYQRQDGKYFIETEDGLFKEHKGEIIIEDETIEATLVDTLTVSYLKYCIIEYAGGSIESGSGIEIADANPIISNSTIRNCIGLTGTIRCCNQCAPLIRDCLITTNSSLRGGAISVTLNSAPIIEGNTISFNTAEDHGGAIYISLSAAEIISNRFLGNRAGGHAGAIYCAISPGIVIRGNVFMGNRSGSNSNSLLLTSRFTAEIKENIFDSFESAGVEVYLENALNDVDATYNFWGNPQRFSFTDIIRDRNIDSSEPLVYYRPFLWAPSVEHPANPARVDSIILCRTDNYSGEIPRGIAVGAPLRIRLAGVDTNPSFRDVVRVRVTSEFDPEGIVIPLRETSANSGIWTGRGQVTERTDQEEFGISDYEGGYVEIFAPFDPEVSVSYKTMSPKPLAENLSITNIGAGDVLHLTDHIPVFSWGYFDVLETPQVSFKLKVYASEDGYSGTSPIWDTGEIFTEENEIVFAGQELQDSKSYYAHLNVWNDRFWSETVELMLRMNSVPTAPVPNLPYTDELTPTLTPDLSAWISDDAEGDSLTYSFEIFALDDNKLINSVSGISPYHILGSQDTASIIDSLISQDSLRVTGYDVIVDSIASWVVPDDLVENDGYNFRVKAFDPLEEGPWSEYRKFWVNSLEEPADPFNLIYPIDLVDVYLLHPTLEWQTALDPDPLSFVRYTVEIDKSAAFTEARIYEDLEPNSFTLPDSLDNVTEYYWRVTALDNTERTTVSTSVGSFYVDTTPSVPVSNAPLDGEERMPHDSLTWEASSDPNPDDLIFYEVEIYDASPLVTPETGELNIAADIAGWMETSLPVEKLKGWEDLVDNHVYFWRVRSRDNHAAASELGQAGSFFYNRYNDPPAPVEVVTTPGDTVMGTTEITFTWNEASDPDLSDPASTLIYDVQCVLGDFETGDVRAFNSEPGHTILVAPLDDNLLWFYRIRTRDNEDAVSPWNEVDSVLVNFAEEVPTPFTLEHPHEDSLVVELDSLMFIWASSSDPDWESSIVYRLEIFPEQGEMFSVETAQTSYHFFEGLTNETDYRWRVTAVDNIGLETAVQTDFNFHTNTTPTIPAAAEMPPELMPPDPLQFTGATDPNQADILTYTVELAPDREFDTTLVQVEMLPHAEGVMMVAVGSLTGQEKLDDDHDYFFRVRATDNHGYDGGYSDPVIFRFNRENDNPGSPAGPFAPVDSVVIRDSNPLLEWNAAFDIDLTDPPDKLVYDLRLDYDAEFEKDAKYEYSTEPGITDIITPDSLKDNTLWFWQVRTRDDDGAVSEWSAMEPFLVNVAEDPPTVPELTTPSSGELLNYLGPIEFAWAASEDIDFMSSITYRIEYGTSPELAGATVIEGLNEPTYTAPYPLENTGYYWRVTAVDNTGLETVSHIDSFTLDTRPSIPQPLTPQPAAPIPLAELLTDGVITWSKSIDPNPKDKISYTIQVGIQLEPVEIEAVSSAGIEETSIPVATWANELKDDQVYAWRVKCIDEHRIESEWSDTLTFFYNSTNDNPGAVTGRLQPADDMEVSTIQLVWGKAYDVDISDPPERISYHVEMTPDSDFMDNIVTFDTPGGITTLAAKDLQDEIRWYWRVRAVDDEDARGPVSSVNVFIYNAQNDPPGEIPGLVSPVEAEEVAFVRLSWEAAFDQDLTDSLSVAYRVELCRDRTFAGEIIEVVTEPMITSAAPSGLADDSWWFWRVRAVDDDGAEGKVSEIRGFTYNSGNNPPGRISSLISPEIDEEVSEVNLSWGVADDIDISDSTVTLAYLVELSMDQKFSGEVIPIQTEPNVTIAHPTGLTDDRYWFWRVRAVDDDGAEGPVMQPRRLILNTRNDPPGRVATLLKPIEESEVAISMLEWEHAYDQDITDPPERLEYLVELCRNKDFDKDIRSLKTQFGSNSIQADKLVDDSWWYWRVRAKDDDGAEGPVSSVGSFIYNTVNDAPTKVSELLTPDDRAEVASVNLSWNASSDKDLTDPPEMLIYRVEFAEDALFTGRTKVIETKPGETSLTAPDIADNTTWFWRVAAVDDEGKAGLVSDVRSFTYNAGNEPPETTVLLEPSRGAVVASIELKWRPVNDPDPFDTPENISYRIELSRDKNFTTGVVQLTTKAGVTTSSPDKIEDNNVWYWRVQAVDDEGLTGAFSKVGTFIYNVRNDAPSPFSLISPADGAQFDSKTVKLTWERAVDVDPGDSVSYTVVIASDATFTTGLGNYRDRSGTEFNMPFDKIGQGGKFFWKVSAIDNKGVVTWGSDSNEKPWSFTVKLPAVPAQP